MAIYIQRYLNVVGESFKIERKRVTKDAVHDGKPGEYTYDFNTDQFFGVFSLSIENDETHLYFEILG